MEKNIILWGTAEGIGERYKLLEKFGFTIVSIVLDDEYLNTIWNGIPVIKKDNFIKRYKEELVVITDRNNKTISEFFIKKNIKYIFLRELYYQIGNEIQLNYMSGSPENFRDILTLLDSNIQTTSHVINSKHLLYNALFHNRMIDVVNDDEEINGIRLIHSLGGCTYDEIYLMLLNDKPICFAEDGFIRSVTPFNSGVSNRKYLVGMSAVLDYKGIYINAKVPSGLENILNSEWQISEDEFNRSKLLINKIKKHKISKYNHQKIIEVNIGGENNDKILVIDQVFGDRSIDLGLANDDTFVTMLKDAIEENPNAEIIVKCHPDRRRGHYEHLKSNGNIYILSDDINPICLLEKVNKVYVCTSQMGFEALMCGKEVHAYGMPFYAGWGLTIDKLKCQRRKKKRSVEEVFHAAYIQYSKYMSWKNNCETDIEHIIDEIICLRGEYFSMLNNNLIEPISLCGKNITIQERKYYSKGYLCQDIEDHDIISFDVFDTLLMRKTLYPDQIFEIMEDRAKKYGIDLPGFVHSRKIAEAPLWSGKFQFKDIYKRLQDMLRLSDDQRDWLMNLEINTEKSCIIPRHDMVDAFNYAKVQGKYIVLVTDMYHSKETITEFLEGIGITGYDEIFISAEYGHSKAGGLFLDVKKKCGEGTILHIGDNPNADVKPAMQNGIDTFLIESSRDILQKSPLGELIDHARNSNELSLLGLVASEVYNSPFSLDSNKIHISDVKNMIYSFIAPLATGFMLWIKNMIIAENYEGILFSARDCYVMKKMYEILINHEIANKTDLVYFYTSRKAAALICKDDQLIRKIYPEFNANEIINGGYNRSKCRENYIKYINSLNIKENGKYAMVDLSSRGTAQYFIQSIFPGDIKGLFLRRLEHRPFISVNADSYAYRKQFVVMYNAILESIFTSFEPSLESFDDNGKAIFADKPQSKENMVYIQKCHEAILEFFEEYVSNLYINNINIDFNFVFKIMQTFSSNSFIVDECIFDKIYIDDGERKEYIAKFLPEKKVIEVENKIMSNNQIITNKSIGYYHCFPFNDIPKNSKVIIYGMGEVGRHYLKQIRLTNYCDVEFATDGNWQNIDYVDVKMVPPEEIAKSNSIIVIANGNAGAANEIKSKLLSLGITESRIIWNDMIISEAMVTETLVGNTNKKLGHYHIFPFANVKKGEQIIIWGMGEVGRHYVKQLKKTGYASINFAVDSNWKNINNAPVNTFSTDILKSKVNAKIVIANGNAGVADKIIQQLKAWGYSDEQIVWNDLIVSESLVVQGATSSKSTVPAKVSLPEPKKVISENSNTDKRGNVLIKAPVDKLNVVLEQVLKSQKDIEIVFS